MRKGEKFIFLGIAAVVLTLMAKNALHQEDVKEEDMEIPFYTTASNQLNRDAMTLYRKYQCKSCHSLWTVKDMLRTVPAPALDGIGSLRSRDWLAAYLASAEPQKILSSRLKAEFRMPSYASMPAEERDLLVEYLSSLRVKDWYLEELKKSECKKLTGEAC